MKKTWLRLTAGLLSAAAAAACIRVLPERIPSADAAAEAAEPFQVFITGDSVAERASKMTFHVETTGEIPPSAWIGIVPAGVPHTEPDSDASDTDWCRVGEIENQTLTLQTPNTIGSYELRAFDEDYKKGAKEVACFPFELTVRGGLSAKLSVENRYVSPNTELKIQAEITGTVPDDAWIGYVPSNVRHREAESDTVNAGWCWVKDIADGGFVIKTPAVEGNYDIRMFDGDSNNAYEVACLPVYVTASEEPDELLVTALEAGSPVLRGQQIPISISMTGTIPSKAWISVIPSDVPHTEKDGDDHNGAWLRLTDIEDGRLTLTAPTTVGDYDIRVYDGEDSDAKEIANAQIKVVYSTMKCRVWTDETWVKPGADVTVHMDITGEYPDDAWVSFIPTDTPHTEKDGDEVNGSWKRVKDAADGTVTLRAPYEEGSFDVRVYDGEHDGAREIAFCTLTVSGKPAVRSAFEPVGGLELNEKKGTLREDDYGVLGWTREGDWAAYQNLDFKDGASYFTLNGISQFTDSSVELHLDSPDGTLIGTCPLDVSGVYGNYRDYTVQTETVTGVHDLYLVFRSASGQECSQVHSFVFSKDGAQPPVQTTTTAPVTTTTVRTTTAPVTTTTVRTTTAPVTTTTVRTTTAPITTTAPVTTTAGLKGDVNLDGKVSVEDAQLALKAYTEGVAGKTPDLTAQQVQNGDVNENGTLSVDDAQFILIYYVRNTVSGTSLSWEALIPKDNKLPMPAFRRRG